MRVRALVAYDGTDFHGWSRQPGEVATVQGVIESTMQTVLGERVRLTVAGRTDAGVHAWGQVVSADLGDDTDVERLKRSVNALCGPVIAVRGIMPTAPEFSARFDARARRYVYRIATAPFRDPFAWRYQWQAGSELEIDAMRAASEPLVGEHDFASFCKVRSYGGSIRRVTEIEVIPHGNAVEIWVEAQSFAHQMVRSLAGFLCDVGRGRRRAAEAAEVLAACDPQANSNVAPPRGLTLWHVSY